MQEAAVTALRFGDEYYRQLLDTYTHKRALFLKGLDDLRLPHTTPRARTTSCWTSPNSGMTPTSLSARRWRGTSALAPCPARAFSASLSIISSGCISPKRTKRCTKPSTVSPACGGSSNRKNKIRTLGQENQSARRLPCGLVCFYAADRRRYGRPRQPVNTGRERPAG